MLNVFTLTYVNFWVKVIAVDLVQEDQSAPTPNSNGTQYDYQLENRTLT